MHTEQVDFRCILKAALSNTSVYVTQVLGADFTNLTSVIYFLRDPRRSSTEVEAFF